MEYNTINLKEYIQNNIVYLDGGMGSLLQEQGLEPGMYPEEWNLSHPEIITQIHKDYYDAGSNIVNTNTFGANILKFSKDKLTDIITHAVNNAKKAREESISTSPKWIALDIGPTGRMLAPFGDFDFEDAVDTFATTIKIGVACGVDLIFIETMSDSYETKAALLAAKENCSLPVFVSNSYDKNGKLLTGANPEAMIAMLEGMGADAIGVNCSLGPKELSNIIDEYLKYSSTPIILKPNAGLPTSVNNKTIYDVLPADFAKDVTTYVKKGIHAIGGCCGTTPKHISELVTLSSDISYTPIKPKHITCVSSYTHAVTFGKEPILIGERINPTGKKLFKEALMNNDIDYILKEGISQQEKDVHILDVNVGLPDIDEVNILKKVICELQAVINLPLQIDTSNYEAMELALRRYNGKPLINSVNGTQESMDAVFPLAKKYGGVIIALTLDESGIPSNAQDRLNIAKKILDTAKSYGLDKHNIIFDPLALTISADSNASITTLESLSLIDKHLECLTSLGVSNISFGLPNRDIINGSFFLLALEHNLSAAIINPYSNEIMNAYYTYCALKGLDNNCSNYISYAKTLRNTHYTPTNSQDSISTTNSLENAIIKGLKEQSSTLTKELLKTISPIDIIQNNIIPALDTVGVEYENKTIYLPNLLMSAEAAKCAFEEIKHYTSTKETSENISNKCTVILATVKGDIHDIGKNIVKLLLSNYGFQTIDLGCDVSPDTITKEVIKYHAPLVGLSALMTTTVPAMEETITLLRHKAPWCKIIVGGAVLTESYARKIGADKYAKDAMETVRYAEKIKEEA